MIAISLPQVSENLPVSDWEEITDTLAQIVHEFYAAKAPRVRQIGPHVKRSDSGILDSTSRSDEGFLCILRITRAKVLRSSGCGRP